MASSPLVPVCVAQDLTMDLMARLMDVRDQLIVAVYDRPHEPALRSALDEVRDLLARGRAVNRELDALAVAA